MLPYAFNPTIPSWILPFMIEIVKYISEYEKEGTILFISKKIQNEESILKNFIKAKEYIVICVDYNDIVPVFINNPCNNDDVEIDIYQLLKISFDKGTFAFDPEIISTEVIDIFLQYWGYTIRSDFVNDGTEISNDFVSKIKYLTKTAEKDVPVSPKLIEISKFDNSNICNAVTCLEIELLYDSVDAYTETTVNWKEIDRLCVKYMDTHVVITSPSALSNTGKMVNSIYSLWDYKSTLTSNTLRFLIEKSSGKHYKKIFAYIIENDLIKEYEYVFLTPRFWKNIESLRYLNCVAKSSKVSDEVRGLICLLSLNRSMVISLMKCGFIYQKVLDIIIKINPIFKKCIL